MLCAPNETDEDKADTEKVVKVLVAMLYAIKSSLRADWGLPEEEDEPEYKALIPRGMTGHEAWGVGLPLELAFFVEKYIRKGHRRGNFQAPQASMLTSQLNAIIDTYGHMETIK